MLSHESTVGGAPGPLEGDTWKVSIVMSLASVGSRIWPMSVADVGGDLLGRDAAALLVEPLGVDHGRQCLDVSYFRIIASVSRKGVLPGAIVTVDTSAR